MLHNLIIKNFVLIEELNVNFSSGFSVITGETGAGKSIILGALALLMGQRADSSTIRVGSEKCIIEGHFSDIDEHINQLLERDDIDTDSNGELIIRREITNKGKSRAFVNDTPVSLHLLKQLSEYLIDIHSQHKNLLLGNAHFQLSVLDLYSQNKVELATYRECYNSLKAKSKELEELRQNIADKLKEQDYLQFQYEQLSGAELEDGELEELEEEEKILAHAQDIKEALATACQILEDDEQGTARTLNQAINEINSIRRYYEESEGYYERLKSLKIELSDITFELNQSLENIEYDPERLTYINSRLDLINNLLAKHNVKTEGELIALMNDIEEQLLEINTSDDRLLKLEKELQLLEEDALKQARKLHKQRSQSAKVIEKKLIAMLNELGMPHVRFVIHLEELSELNNNGLSQVLFLFSANKEISLEPVAEIASGGEISRLMLGLKALIANQRSLPTIIFDEIDTGVSGDTADKIGQILKKMGENMQVMAVTHLPQIAASGKAHYFIFKEHQSSSTKSYIRCLDENERIEEIARMQSGNNLNDITLAAAKELLSNAQS